MDNAKDYVNNTINSKGAVLEFEFKNLTQNMSIICYYGHKFNIKYFNLLNGDWCPVCLEYPQDSKNLSYICNILESFGFNYRLNIFYNKFKFDIELLDVDVPTYILIDSNIDQILKNFINIRLLIIHIDSITDPNLSDFFLQVLSIDGPLLHNFPKDKFIIQKKSLSEINIVNLINRKKNENKINLPRKNKEKRLLIYTRVSTSLQKEDGVSLEVQKSFGIEYAKNNNLNYYLYEDAGFSGAKASNRPNLIKLLEDVERGDFVYVYSQSRVTRNTKDFLEIKDYFDTCGIFLVIKGEIQKNDPNSRLMLTMHAALDQNIRENISQNVSDTLSKLSEDNKLKSKPIFGYRFVKKKSKFEPDPIEQRTLQKIRELRDQLRPCSYTKICEWLNNNFDLYPCRKSLKWYPSEIKKIMIQNEIITYKLDRDMYNVPNSEDIPKLIEQANINQLIKNKNFNN